MKRGDLHHNTRRPDYAEPARYQEGLDFDSPVERRTRNWDQLGAFLDRVRPASVLEIGPGSGHLTRRIVTYPTVERYVAVDINGAFLDYLRPRLTALRPDLSVTLVESTIAQAPDESFDAVVMISAVHHIPDRDELFTGLHKRLRPAGRVLAVDPTHYLFRLRKMMRKVLKPGYLAYQLSLVNRGEFSTHSMCQLAEYRAIAAKAGFLLTRVEFAEQPRRLLRWCARGVPLGPLWRWASAEILVEFERS